MCGIAGIANLDATPLAEPRMVCQMASMLVHRGPDEDGYYNGGSVAFGFRRLSIIDLSTGTQPIANEDESVWVMLNGEIYNYVELRDQLEAVGHRFRSASDTEVIAHGYESWGLDVLQRLRGMFALAIWDKRSRRLVLARDRLGKKPLFYAIAGGQIAFASEIKALLPWPLLDRTIDPEALHDYLTFLFVPSPKSIFKQVRKVPPAHYLVADCHRSSIRLERYWSIPPVDPPGVAPAQYAQRLRETLEEAVALRLRSDVPLGAFLSGGVDSTAVVGLAARQAPGLQTFSVGFSDPRFDETRYAALVASHLATRHHREEVDANSLPISEFLNLIWCLDEPFADSSAIPTYWVCKAARKHVTVALSGDGGDEILGGYTRYRRYLTLLRMGWLPRPLLQVGELLTGWMRTVIEDPALSDRVRQAEKAFRLAAAPDEERLLGLLTYFDEAGKQEMYQGDWRDHLNGYSTHQLFQEQLAAASGDRHPLARFFRRDVAGNLADDCLAKVDRASMACSLEVRCPLLDQKVVELAMSIPPEYKIANGRQKVILKQALADVLPPAIVSRGKQGFEVPFAAWLRRGDWKQLLLDTLSPDALQAGGIFRKTEVTALRDALLKNPEASGAPISAYQLRHRVWLLFVFELWRNQLPGYPALAASSSSQHFLREGE
jgi:asparagine synthase (glutamine-hydrolysing)